MIIRQFSQRLSTIAICVCVSEYMSVYRQVLLYIEAYTAIDYYTYFSDNKLTSSRSGVTWWHQRYWQTNWKLYLGALCNKCFEDFLIMQDACLEICIYFINLKEIINLSKKCFRQRKYLQKFCITACQILIEKVTNLCFWICML